MDVVKSKSSFELLRGQMPNWCEFCPKIKPKRNPPTSSQSQLFLVTGFTNWLLGVLIFFLLKLGGGHWEKKTLYFIMYCSEEICLLSCLYTTRGSVPLYLILSPIELKRPHHHSLCSLALFREDQMFLPKRYWTIILKPCSFGNIPPGPVASLHQIQVPAFALP